MPETKTIYFFSGLGADRRAFQFLKTPEGYRQVHIGWQPANRNDTLSSYASRLAAEVEDNQPVLIGLSFGGLVAQEIAGLKPGSKVILISTVKSRGEMPPWFRLAALLRLHWVVGKWILVFPKFIPYYIFGVKRKAEKRILDTILNEMDPVFLKWAIKAAQKWKGANNSEPVYHIHGEKDMLFPLRYVKPDCVIKNAGHMAVLTHAREISAAIREVL